MNIRFRLCRAACVLALAVCAASPALAKDSGFTLGFNLGQAQYGLEGYTSGLLNPGAYSELEDNDIALSVSAGWRFNSYLGVELGLSSFGHANLSEYGTITTVPPAAPATNSAITDSEVGVSGPSLVLVGTLPLNNFELFAKAGVMYAETSVQVVKNYTSGGLGTTLSSERSEATETIYGVGVGYTFAHEFNVRLEYMLAPKVGDAKETVETDLDVISLGLQYRF